MEWSADREHHRALRACFFGQLGGALHRGFVAGDDDLIRRVDVRRGDNLFDLSRSLHADRLELFDRQGKDRRHCSYSDRHRLLHVFAAIADDAHRVCELQCPGANMR